MMYLASAPWHATSSFLMAATFLSWLEEPDSRAIVRYAAKMPRMVSAALAAPKSVFWRERLRKRMRRERQGQRAQSYG